jgi:LPS-assembly lipoprotein
MSSFKTIAAVLCVLALAGCGFEPLYGKTEYLQAADSTGAINRAAIDIANVPDREGQRLRNLLIDRLYVRGRPTVGNYILALTPLKTDITNLGIRKDATSTRAMTNVGTHIQLVERISGRVVLERDVHAVGGYNQLDNQLATIVSKQSVTDHMLEELSDSVVREIDLFFNRAEPPKPFPVVSP